jgi:ribosome maturation factor RimP
MSAEEDIAEALRPTVRAAGLEIWDVERSGASVRILVERDGGVDLDSISEVSRAISAVLDSRDDLVPAGRYTLEVSSPGLERRLRYPHHFASHVGQEVAIKTAEAVNGSRRLRGALVGATDEAITVRVSAPGTGREEVQVPMRLVERANTVFSWGETSKPSRSAKSAKPGGPAAQVGTDIDDNTSAMLVGRHVAGAPEEA